MGVEHILDSNRQTMQPATLFPRQGIQTGSLGQRLRIDGEPSLNIAIPFADALKARGYHIARAQPVIGQHRQQIRGSHLVRQGHKRRISAYIANPGGIRRWNSVAR